LKVEARLVQKHNDKTGKTEYALVSKKSGRVLKWFGARKPSDDHVKEEERRIQYFKHAGGELDIIDDEFGKIPRNQWDATPHTPYTQQYPDGFPLEDKYYEMGMGSLEKYPTVAAVLAAPLPKETKPEQWDRTFDKIASIRPGKRLGVEFKTYVQFHRKEFPRGKLMTHIDVVRTLELSPEEIRDSLSEALDYLLTRKVIKKASEGYYRLL
jgi:hypothetical protein